MCMAGRCGRKVIFDLGGSKSLVRRTMDSRSCGRGVVYRAGQLGELKKQVEDFAGDFGLTLASLATIESY